MLTANALMLQTGNAEEIAKYSKRTTRVTPQHNEECKELLQLMGVPIVTVGSFLIMMPIELIFWRKTPFTICSH